MCVEQKQEVDSYTGRDEVMMQMGLSMQDRGTQIAVIAGTPGIGKRTVAAALSRSLISFGHWTEAYWIDLGGTQSHSTAGEMLARFAYLGILFGC